MYNLLRALANPENRKLLIVPCIPGRYAGDIYILLDRADWSLGVFDFANPDCCVACIREEVRFIKTGQASLFIKKCVHSSAQKHGLEDTNPCTPVHKIRPPHPSQRIEKDELNKRTETTTTVQDKFWEPRAREAPAESSSSFSAAQDSQISGNIQPSASQPLSRAGRVADRPSDQARCCGLVVGSVRDAPAEPTDMSVSEALPSPPAELVDQAIKILNGELGTELSGKILARLNAGDPAWWIRDALTEAKRMKPRNGEKRRFCLVIGVLNGFRKDGKPLVESAAPPAARPAPQENWNPGPLVEDCDEPTKMLRAQEALDEIRGCGCDLELFGADKLAWTSGREPREKLVRLAHTLKPQIIRRLREAELAADQAEAESEAAP